MKFKIDNESINVPVGKIVFFTILALILLSLLSLGLKILLLPANVAHKVVDTAGQVVNKTFDKVVYFTA